MGMFSPDENGWVLKEEVEPLRKVVAIARQMKERYDNAGLSDVVDLLDELFEALEETEPRKKEVTFSTLLMPGPSVLEMFHVMQAEPKPTTFAGVFSQVKQQYTRTKLTAENVNAARAALVAGWARVADERGVAFLPAALLVKVHERQVDFSLSREQLERFFSAMSEEEQREFMRVCSPDLFP